MLHLIYHCGYEHYIIPLFVSMSPVCITCVLLPDFLNSFLLRELHELKRVSEDFSGLVPAKKRLVGGVRTNQSNSIVDFWEEGEIFLVAACRLTHTESHQRNMFYSTYMYICICFHSFPTLSLCGNCGHSAQVEPQRCHASRLHRGIELTRKEVQSQ